MATYSKWTKAQGNVTAGVWSLYVKINFAEDQMAANDIFQLAKLKNGWIILSSWYRMPGTASTSTATMDIGTTKDGTGQEIAAGLDLDSIGNDDWNVGVITPDHADGSKYQVRTSDTYLTCEALGSTVTDGVLEINLQILSSLGDSEPVDMNIDD